LTTEERQAALGKAARARRARSELFGGVQGGSVHLADALAREDEIAKHRKATALLGALPGYAPARTAALMRREEIADSRQVGGSVPGNAATCWPPPADSPAR
jgi:hypothetical protein